MVSESEKINRNTRYIYVCDRCGSLITITDEAIPEGVAWFCADCGSDRAWEFTDAQKAREHSEHIQRGVASGLFRRV